MNGEDLPYLNGFPVRLVIPGVYSDSWIKMLSNITVTDKYKHLFFMDHAYRVPLTHKSHTVVRGVAWDGGAGIKEVQISLDGGKTWDKAQLDDGSQGRYAYRTFRYSFKPMKLGKMTIMSKAINKLGEEQPFAKDVKWNHGGYKFNGIDEVKVEVV